MAKGRILKTQISHSLQVNELSLKATLLFTWLIPHVDDFGRFYGEPKRIKGIVFPLRDDISIKDVQEGLIEIKNKKLITLYENDGSYFLQLINFESHQTGLHKRTVSIFPEPKPPSKNLLNEIPGNSGKFREILYGQDNEKEKINSENNQSEVNFLSYVSKPISDAVYDVFPGNSGKFREIPAEQEQEQEQEKKKEIWSTPSHVSQMNPAKPPEFLKNDDFDKTENKDCGDTIWCTPQHNHYLVGENVTTAKKRANEEVFFRDAKEILEFLNEKIKEVDKKKRGFRPTKSSLKFIIARLKDGANIEDCRSMIAMKFDEWAKSKTMFPYLRPKTLFCETNFDQYCAQLKVVPTVTSEEI